MMKTVGGVLLTVLAFVTGWTLLSLPVQYREYAFFLPLLCGFAGALVVFILFPRLRLQRLYVAGHEFVHWLAAKIFRRRTGKFAVGKSGGAVEIERPNIWIVLAPYVVPVFTLAWIGLYGVARMISAGSWGPIFHNIVYAGIGVSYSHHLVLTASAVTTSQRDFSFYGIWLSLPAVLWGNLLLLLTALMLVTHQWQAGVTLFVENSEEAVRAVLHVVAYATRELQDVW